MHVLIFIFMRSHFVSRRPSNTPSATVWLATWAPSKKQILLSLAKVVVTRLYESKFLIYIPETRMAAKTCRFDGGPIQSSVQTR